MALARYATQTVTVTIPCPDCQQPLSVEVEVELTQRDKYSTCNRGKECCHRPPTGPNGERRYVAWDATVPSTTYHDCPPNQEV